MGVLPGHGAHAHCQRNFTGHPDAHRPHHRRPDRPPRPRRPVVACRRDSGGRNRRGVCPVGAPPAGCRGGFGVGSHVARSAVLPPSVPAGRQARCVGFGPAAVACYAGHVAAAAVLRLRRTVHAGHPSDDRHRHRHAVAHSPAVRAHCDRHGHSLDGFCRSFGGPVPADVARISGHDGRNHHKRRRVDSRHSDSALFRAIIVGIAEVF